MVVGIDSPARYLLLLLALLVLAPYVADVHAQPARPVEVATQVCSSCQPLEPDGEQVPPPPREMSNGPSTSYDEQLGMTFTQSFTSMLYNSTAVEQSDSSSGVGPGYLLNGLSNTGYWYQVGLDYNWIYTSGGYDAGFHMGYEVFNPSGNSIFPIVCCGGLLSFSGPVNEGDVVALNLYFTSSGQVVFLAKDYNTGAYASETYSAEGATYFTGLDQTANSYGFFTGLMTEWYHPSAYYGGEQEVTYSSTFALSSAYMWMDEFESNGQTNGTLLFWAGSGLLSYSDPTQLQAFSSNGATEYSDAYEFLTGALSQIPLTVSYSVQGSDIGYSPPILTYVTGGETKTSTLGTSSSVFNCDPGSSWSVQPMLGGSNSSERWETVQGTSGTASVPQALAFVYYNQYYPSFQITAAAQTKFDSDMTLVITATQFGTPGTSVCQIITSSAATASCQAWVDEGGLVVFPQFLNNPPADTRWQNAAGALSASQVLSSSSDRRLLRTGLGGCLILDIRHYARILGPDSRLHEPWISVDKLSDVDDPVAGLARLRHHVDGDSQPANGLNFDPEVGRRLRHFGPRFTGWDHQSGILPSVPHHSQLFGRRRRVTGGAGHQRDCVRNNC